MTDDARELKENAVRVLADLLLLELSPARWKGVAGILDSLAADLENGDLRSLAEATAQLELAGPVRVTRIGAAPAEPPPPPVRERVNELIHALSGQN